MPGLELWIAAIMQVALVAYALTGGADFGGGVWELVASGPRKARQRRTVLRAIAPIWEANHVWLIVVVVILFVGFPKVFAAVGIALHVPLAIMLVGIVMRGAAFVFRTYDPKTDGITSGWGVVFAAASTLTPVMLGLSLGAVASGQLQAGHYTGHPTADFVSAWCAPFPLAVGAFVLGLFSFLAAVYLTLETDDRDLQDDFRTRAMVSAVIVGALAWLCILLAATGAPHLYEGLTSRWWSIPLHIVTGFVALGCIAALWLRRFALARLLSVLQVSLVVVGFGLSVHPYLIAGSLTLQSAAAPKEVLGPLLGALIFALVLVLPAYAWLLHVFKGNGKRS